MKFYLLIFPSLSPARGILLGMTGVERPLLSVAWLALPDSVPKRQAPGSHWPKENEEACTAYLNLAVTWNRAIPAKLQPMNKANERSVSIPVIWVEICWAAMLQQHLTDSLLLPATISSRWPGSCIFWGLWVSFSFNSESFSIFS